MKQLKDYSNDVYKCTKCGLCQSVCPIFEHTGLECAVSRGKFNLLNGIIKGEVKMSPKVFKHMDLCINCNACTSFCPSAINAEEIITCAKNEAVTCNMAFFNRNLLSLIRIFINIIRLFKVDKILKQLYPLFYKLGTAGKTLIFLSQIIYINVKRKKIKTVKKSNFKILYFSGCINEYINPSVKNATLNLLESQGFEVIMPDFDCCGIPHRTAGDLKNFKKYAINNLEKINENFDYIITDCASCKSAWAMYADILDGELKNKAVNIAAKAIHINDFLQNFDFSDKQPKKSTRVTYHHPCHLTNFDEKKTDPTEFLKQIKNTDYIEMKDSTKCCGAGGGFFVKHPVISNKISKQKAANIIDTSAQTVLTACPSCIMGLHKGLLSKDSKIEVKHICEFLDELKKITF